ncbi:hypothetical protein [Arthrobacter sp. UYEF21]|uniref:hypothetical protein n=1 Tax=Arthrobacter sp. UYEF21 TaxID=1756364 RepID=UPI00339617EF
MSDDFDGDELKPHARWILGIGGLGCAVAGAVATFLPATNAAGVPILLVLGGAFGYVACTGQQLLHLNKDGVRLSQVRRLRRTLTDVVNDGDVPVHVKERILETAQDNGVSLSPHDYESAVYAQLRQMASSSGFSIDRNVHLADREYDFILHRPDSDKKVYVEVKAMANIAARSNSIRRLLKNKGPAIDGNSLFIINGPVSPSVRLQAELFGVSLVVWSPGTDFEDAAGDALFRAGMTRL